MHCRHILSFGYNYSMPYTLHQVDEETDTGVYQTYLRAQTEADLLDILHHLDPERYPARLDAAQRELRRRRVLHLPGYTSTEYTIRFLCMAAFAVSLVTLALAALLHEPDAAMLNGPGATSLQDGMPVSRIIFLMLLVVLQTIVTAGVRLGLYPLFVAVLAWWTLSRALPVRRRQARADVWRLALSACLTLLFSVLLACNPDSALPDLFSPIAPRAVTLFDPFALL